LRRDGWEISMFHSGTGVVERVASEKPDLIVSDVQMPKMTGLELIAGLRNEGFSTPAILVTADPSSEVRDSALSLGVRHIFRKPYRNIDDLVRAVVLELGPEETPESIRELDELRMGLLTDLSHQLRTPITAMKLAMEGLFSHVTTGADESSQKLADISRRNIDRIVSLVENQLELLEMTIGEVTISRRLVDLDSLVGKVAGRLFEGDPDYVSRFDSMRSDTNKPRYVFTDPDALDTILTCLLSGGPANVQRELIVDFDEAADEFQLLIRLNYLDQTVAESAEKSTKGQSRPVPAMTRLDFEYRAYTSMLEELGGSVMMEKDCNVKEVRISLPGSPPYDRHKDFLNPLRGLRKAAKLSHQRVSCVKVELDTNNAVQRNDNFTGFVERCHTVLGEGDFILRGRKPGVLYLSMVNRSREDLDRVREYLDSYAKESNESGFYVAETHTLMDDEQEILRLVQGVELV
jgi:CheY-like chemotaxis protein